MIEKRIGVISKFRECFNSPAVKNNTINAMRVVDDIKGKMVRAKENQSLQKNAPEPIDNEELR